MKINSYMNPFKKCFYFSRRSVSSSDEDESQDGFDLTESERGMKLKTYIDDS